MPDAYTERLNLDGQPWITALFRYSDGTWALPVKKEIRHWHHLDMALTAQVHLTVIE